MPKAPKTITHNGFSFYRTAQGSTLAPSHVAAQLAAIELARPLTLEKMLTGMVYGVAFKLTRSELKTLTAWRTQLEAQATEATPSKPKASRVNLGGSVGQGRCPSFFIKLGAVE